MTDIGGGMSRTSAPTRDPEVVNPGSERLRGRLPMSFAEGCHSAWDPNADRRTNSLNCRRRRGQPLKPIHTLGRPTTCKHARWLLIYLPGKSIRHNMTQVGWNL
jgi:hypothetical protein